MQLVARYCMEEFGMGDTTAPIKKQTTCQSEFIQT
jgi:hypothetical protein